MFLTRRFDVTIKKNCVAMDANVKIHVPSSLLIINHKSNRKAALGSVVSKRK